MRISDWSSDVCSSDLTASTTCSRCAPCSTWTTTSAAPTPTSSCSSLQGNSNSATTRTPKSSAAWPSTSWPATATTTPRTTPSCRSEEHTSELQSLMRISYAVFCLKKKKHKQKLN